LSLAKAKRPEPTPFAFARTLVELPKWEIKEHEAKKAGRPKWA
jgi:hypothetical protein